MRPRSCGAAPMLGCGCLATLGEGRDWASSKGQKRTQEGRTAFARVLGAGVVGVLLLAVRRACRVAHGLAVRPGFR